MKKSGLLLMWMVIGMTSICQMVNKVADPVEWVNPLMGSDSKPNLSNGNTCPSIVFHGA